MKGRILAVHSDVHVQGKRAKAQVKTDGIPRAKKAKIFHCKAGQRVEEMVEPAWGQPNVTLRGAGNSACSQAGQLKQLHSRFPAQVVDVVPWFSGRVQETCWEVCQVCAGMERLHQSCTQVSIDVSQVWCIS